jgi:phosphoglycerate dehydrogenase-like enzyme
MQGRSPTGPVRVVIATPLQKELVERIAGSDPRVEVLHDPALLPPPRYPCDHRGDPGFRRDPDGERRWRELLAHAEVLFGIPGDTPEGLAAAVHDVPALRWVQATAAGAGQQVQAAGLSRADLERVTVTSATGVHAGPLAEYCLFGLLAFAKGWRRLARDQQARRWEHYPVAELRDRSALILGLGRVGAEVARLARCFGMRTIAVKRHPDAGDRQVVDELHPASRLHDLVGRADAVVVTLPLTRETEGRLDREAIARMRPGAVLVNLGRGRVVDEEALVEALEDGRIAGAVLDVTAVEPPPQDSPLWSLDNVLLSPHTMALSERENERIVELFRAELGRYLAGEPLEHRVDPELLY